jgi:hypothetical protein
MLSPTGITHLEDPVVADRWEVARGRGGFSVGGGVSQVPALLQSRLSVLGSTLLVVASWTWWAGALLVAAGALLECAALRLTRREWDCWTGQAAWQRRSGYTFELGMGAAAKELRIFGLAGWLVDRHHWDWQAPVTALRRVRWRGVIADLPITGLQVVVIIGLVWLAGHAALRVTYQCRVSPR